MAKTKLVAVGFLLLALFVSQSIPLPAAATYDQAKAVSYLKTRPLDEWSIMALTAADALSDVDLNFLKSDPGGKPTDLEKRILAIAGAGQNPSTFGSVDLVQKLVDVFNGTEINSAESSNLLNDDIFGLLALSISQQNQSVGNQLAAFIKQNQNADGGWSYTYRGSPSDSNDTAMAIMALLANGESSSSISIKKGFEYIASTKSGNGYSFDSYSGFGPDTGSTAWIVSAFAAAEKPIPAEALGFLENIQLSDGAFAWQQGSEGSSLMTAYALIALTRKYYPIKSWGNLPPATANCSAIINATKTVITPGETTFLEATGFASPIAWTLSDPTKAILLNSRVNTGKNTADVTGANPGTTIITAAAANCSTQITITVASGTSTSQIGQFQIFIKGPSNTVFQGNLHFNQATITDSSGQNHAFTDARAIGTVSGAAKIGNFTFVIRNTSLGLFVESIGDIKPSGLQGWMYAVNGTKPNIGAAELVLNGGDQVIWFYGNPDDPVPAFPNSSTNAPSQSINLSTNIVAHTAYSPAPAIELTVSKSQINLGQSVTFTWNSQNAQFVVNSNPGNWAGSSISGNFSTQPSETVTYSLMVGSCPSGTAWTGHLDTSQNPALPLCVSANQAVKGTVDSASAVVTVNQSPSIVFGIDVNSINFGSLKAGENSAPKTVKLTNSGNVDLRISATLQNSDDLYQQGLFVFTDLWQNFQTDLDANFGKNIDIILKVPTSYAATGNKAGTLIFWASPK